MAIIASNSGSNYTPIEAGTYVARCYSMIVLGTIPETFMGEEKMLTKVRLTWELPLELKSFKEGEPEKPLTISKEFTLSMSDKANLRKTLEGWRGKGFTDEEAKSFDITKLLGVQCMLSVIHKKSQSGKTYADISSVSMLPKGTTCPEQINSSFEMNYDNIDFWEKFNRLPDFIKDKMRKSQEFARLEQPENQDISHADQDIESGEPEDGLPF